MTFEKVIGSSRILQGVSLGHVERQIKKFKIQLEFNLATAVKDNHEWLYKYISNKRKIRKNLHPL